MYDQLVKYPQEIVPIFDLVVYQEYNNTSRVNIREDAVEDDNGNTRIQVRTFNLNFQSR